MTTGLFNNPKTPFFSSGGTSLNSSGKLYFREPGSGSTTLKPIYANSDLSAQLVNPVVLDSAGRAPAIFLNGDYNVQHTDSNDVQIWRIDNYQPPTVDGQFQDWDASLTYALNDYVRYTDGQYYISLASSNKSNIPPSSLTYWSQAFFITVYNSTVEYQDNEVVYYAGNIWTAYGGPHAGITPGTDETKWRTLGFSPPSPGFFDLSYMYMGGGSAAVISFNVGLNVTEDTYETIGPLLSGADHEWAALPPIPDNAKAFIITVSCSLVKSSGSDETCGMSTTFRQPGEDRQYFGAQCKAYGGATAGRADASSSCVVIVPLDSNQRFEAYWRGFPGTVDSSTVDIYYNGYMQ